MAMATPQPSQAPLTPNSKAPASISPAINRRAQEEYRRVQIENASPTRLIIMLYDGAIRFCTLGLEAMRERNIEAQNTNLIRTQKIITEFMSSLNQKEGGEVAENLSRVYTFMLEQLVTANLYDRPKPVETVLAMLRELRESWETIETSAQNGSAPSAPGVKPPSGPAGAQAVVRPPMVPRIQARPNLNPTSPTSPQVSRLGDHRA